MNLTRPLHYVDILSIIPTYAELAVTQNLQGGYGPVNHDFNALRVIRCLRMARLLKSARYTSEMRVMAETIQKR